MRKTFKYRIYPMKAQYTAMRSVLNACRWVYNESIAVRKNAWEQEHRSVSCYDTMKMIPRWSREHPFLRSAYSQSLQNACTRVDLAFQDFFRRVKAGKKPGYPRFRGQDRYDSFTYPQSGFCLLSNEQLRLSKIGNVRIVLHRPIEGRIKTLTVRRNNLGNWYATFSCEMEPCPLAPSPKVVGIDVGLTHFATLSTSEHIPNPRFFRQGEKTIAKAQRRLSKCKKGSPEYHERKRVIQHIHQRITNRRKDFAHKLSRQLVNDFQIIAFEKLDIQRMQENNWRSMNKSISDAAWGQLIRFTTEKAEWAARSVVLVNPCNTTQICSNCGKIVRKDLSVRVHECPYCGLKVDRDLNASLNILALGLQCARAGSSVTGRSRANLFVSSGVATMEDSGEKKRRESWK